MRIESRITGIGQKPNVAGKVLVKWDYNGTVGTYICSPPPTSGSDKSWTKSDKI